MTPLRQRMIEDMRIRNFATTTQRSYVHYVAEFAKYFHRDPAELDLEAIRQYQLYLSQEKRDFPAPAWMRNSPLSWPPMRFSAFSTTSTASSTAPCC